MTSDRLSPYALQLKLHLSSDRNLDFDTSLNVDNDLLDDLGGGVETTK